MNGGIFLIRKYGYRENFKNNWYRMFKVGEYKYWTMGAPIGSTILINRKCYGQDEKQDIATYKSDKSSSGEQSR